MSPEGEAWSQHDAALWDALRVLPPTLSLACVEQTPALEGMVGPGPSGTVCCWGVWLRGQRVGAVDKVGEGDGPANGWGRALG